MLSQETPLPSGEGAPKGRVRVHYLHYTTRVPLGERTRKSDPHPTLRATFSQREKGTPIVVAIILFMVQRTVDAGEFFASTSLPISAMPAIDDRMPEASNGSINIFWLGESAIAFNASTYFVATK